MPAASRATGSDVRRHTDLAIPVGSETVAATRYEPVDRDGPSPALLMYVPYPKDDSVTYGSYDPINLYLARHGYEVVVADMIGTGASTGHFDDMFTSQEGVDAAAIVRWLADQPWTTGSVGMYGKSYGGFTALAAATEHPDALEAIVPIYTPYTGYRNGYTQGGLFELLYIGMDWLTLMQSLDVKPPSRRDPDGAWASVWDDHLDSVTVREPWLFRFLDHQVKDDYWADKDLPVTEIRTPTLAVGGWRDPYTADTVDYYDAIDAPKRLLLGPWRHQMPHRGRETAIAFRAEVVDWFDRFLRDQATGALDTPPIRAWTERDGGGKIGGGDWRSFDRWPTADGETATTTFALTPDGLVPADDFDAGAVARTYETDCSVGIRSVVPPTIASPPPDSTPDDARSVTFDSTTIKDSLEVTGTGAATIPLRTSMQDPSVSVRLVDVAPDGTARTVTQGTARLRCNADQSALRAVPRDDLITCDIPLRPVSHVFEPGHRCRVSLAGALFPETMPTGDGGAIKFESTPTTPATITLPGRTLRELPFDDTISMASPDESVAPTADRITSFDRSFNADRDSDTGRVTVRQTTAVKVDLPHADLSRAGTSTAAITPTDPDSLLAENELTWRLDYPTDTVRVTARNRFDREDAEAETVVRFDDRIAYQQSWSR